MRVKTVRVTNPRNVLVQIPSYIVGEWALQLNDTLEVHYDGTNVTIKPSLSGRGYLARESDCMAREP